MQAGIHTLSWDGNDDAGRASASGVYIVRMTAGETHGAGELRSNSQESPSGATALPREATVRRVTLLR